MRRRKWLVAVGIAGTFGWFARLLRATPRDVEIITDPDRLDIIERRVVKGAVQVFDEDGNCLMIVRPLVK